MKGYAKPYDFVDRITNIQNLNDVDESACDVANSALGEGIDLTNNAKVLIQFLKNLLKLNYCKKVFFSSSIYVFARDVLPMKKLEIKKTKPTFIISVLKV